jgi:S-methylmethionine-dependent homocysteine/selenocysteine methylase
MKLEEALAVYPYLLMEAAIIENLKRRGDLVLDPLLLSAPLIHDQKGREALSGFFVAYISIAHAAGVPCLICTPTWRANRERLEEAQIASDINADGVSFLKAICSRRNKRRHPVYIGGLMGCKNDAYRPEEALDRKSAKDFHGWQAERLAAAGPDFLMAATMPAASEAAGMALALEGTGIPYIISFVIDRKGRVLDGSPLSEAFAAVDAAVSRRPLGFMVNCAYPSFLKPHIQPAKVMERLIGYQANGSSLDHSELDGAGVLRADAVSDWGDQMIALHRGHGIKILGGCCGTGPDHLSYIAEHLKPE